MLKKLFTATAITGLFFAVLIGPSLSVSAKPPLSACEVQPNSALCAEEGRKKTATGVLGGAVNILLFIVGAASVIAIIYAGLRYVISGGRSQTVEEAKNILTYAVVGLAVSLLAYAIINWVVQGLI